MSETLSGLKVWLVHDWLTGMRGGEKVLLELVRMFPSAKVATLIHVKGSVDREIEERVARVSRLNELPRIGVLYRSLLPTFPAAVKELELDACDVVISSSHCVAKGVTVPRGAKHLCYCHTPMRYIWGMEDQYLEGWSLKRAALGAAKPYLQQFDLQNDAVDVFVANSKNVAERVKRIYEREAAVVYPGVDVEKFAGSGEKGEGSGLVSPPTGAGGGFYLVVSALVGYKRIDLAVQAFVGTGRKLVVIGAGPESDKLREMAKGAGNVEFLGRQPDEVVRDYMRRCRAFVFPGEEDFGMTPVEAQASGRPVIAYGKGGVLETVVGLDETGNAKRDTQNRGGATGVFFAEQTAEGLRGALDVFEKHEREFDAGVIRANAAKFGWGNFREGMRREVLKLLGGK